MSAPEIFLIMVFLALLSMYSIPLIGDPYQLQDAPRGIILGSIPSTKGGIMAFPLAHIYMFGLGQSLQINLVEQLWLKHWVLCIVICIQCILTHWGWVTHICASKLCHHLFRKCFFASSVPNHYLIQCWNIANWALRDKFQWNFNWISNILLHENVIENIICEMASMLPQPQYVTKCACNSCLVMFCCVFTWFCTRFYSYQFWLLHRHYYNFTVQMK